MKLTSFLSRLNVAALPSGDQEIVWQGEGAKASLSCLADRILDLRIWDVSGGEREQVFSAQIKIADGEIVGAQLDYFTEAVISMERLGAD